MVAPESVALNAGESRAACLAGSLDLLRHVEIHSGEKISRCFQCDKCATGCPMAVQMEYTPNALFRLVQLGDRSALASNTCWFCVSCYACSIHCPNDIDIAQVMDSLRELALEEGYKPVLPQAYDFHKIFLGCVRRSGRVSELALMARYNFKMRRPFMRLPLGLALLRKGRLELWPFQGKSLHRLFKRVEESR